jgi:hypothetical protein
MFEGEDNEVEKSKERQATKERLAIRKKKTENER